MSAIEETIKKEAREIAAEEDIPLYKAEILEYLAASAAEGAAKKKKEALKGRLEKRLRSLGKYAELVPVPEQKGKVAVARIYVQPQPACDFQAAKSLLDKGWIPQQIYDQIIKRAEYTCFSVTGMDELSGDKLVRETEEFWKKAQDKLTAQLRESTEKK